MTVRPSAAARLMDAAALALVATGGALYFVADQGMRAIHSAPTSASTIEGLNLVRWFHYRRMFHAGLAIAAAGVVVGVVSYIRARRPAGALPASTAPDAPTA